MCSKAICCNNQEILNKLSMILREVSCFLGDVTFLSIRVKNNIIKE